MMENNAVVKECSYVSENTESDLGRIVLATAGRDAGGVFTVVRTEGTKFLYICDGRSRRIEKPKRKKRKHLKFIGMSDEETLAFILSGEIKNRQVRHLLSEYESKERDRLNITVSK